MGHESSSCRSSRTDEAMGSGGGGASVRATGGEGGGVAGRWCWLRDEEEVVLREMARGREEGGAGADEVEKDRGARAATAVMKAGSGAPLRRSEGASARLNDKVRLNDEGPCAFGDDEEAEDGSESFDDDGVMGQLVGEGRLRCVKRPILI